MFLFEFLKPASCCWNEKEKSDSACGLHFRQPSAGCSRGRVRHHRGGGCPDSAGRPEMEKYFPVLLAKGFPAAGI